MKALYNTFIWVTVIYLVSFIISASGCKKIIEDAEEEGEDAHTLLTRIVGIYAPYIPLLNTFICFALAYFAVTWWLDCLRDDIRLFIAKMRMRYTKGTRKFTIGRYIITEFYE